MGQYTEFLYGEAITLSPDDDNYEEKLLETASFFRGFDEAFTAFIIEHGYLGDSADVHEKAKFLHEKYKKSSVKLPRDFKEWFTPEKHLKRETAFSICFAFGLDISETNDFFRRVQFERSFDCHTINEAVYYYCIKNGLTYLDAQEIISRIPKIKKAKILPECEVLYTETIVEYIDGIRDKEKVIQLITDNICDFEYNNATAIKYIQKLWLEISKDEGIAVQEGLLIDRAKNRFQDRTRKGSTDTRSRDVVVKEVKRENEMKLDDYVIAEEGASTWTIFSQIIGLDNRIESKYAVQYDRSISSVLNKNALLPLGASYCFPSQHSIDKLIRGEMSDNELIRKMLIFLVFYTYWAKKTIKNGNVFYVAKAADSEECMDTIDSYLSDVGYPQMYIGNPYDWLFMWALNDEHPLEAFRTYMGEVFTIREEQND